MDSSSASSPLKTSSGNKPVDAELIRFLTNYATTSAECSDLMRAYLLGLLARSHLASEVMEGLESGLRDRYMYEIGVKPELKAMLLQYQVGQELPQDEPDVAIIEEPPADWTDLISQSYGAAPASERDNVKLDDQLPLQGTLEQRRRIEELVNALKEKMQGAARATRTVYGPRINKVAEQARMVSRDSKSDDLIAFLDSYISPSPDMASLPAEIVEEIDKMQFTFNAESGLVAIQPPPGMRVRLEALKPAVIQPRVSDTVTPGKFIQPTMSKFPYRTASEPAPESFLDSLDMKSIPHMPQIRILMRDPALGNVLHDLTQQLWEKDAKTAYALLNLLSVRIQDKMKEASGTAPRDDPDEEYRDSWYHEWLQPPLRQRLRQINNFLSEEDIYRDPKFMARCREISEYLVWLWEKDERKQLHKSSQETSDLFFRAVNTLLVHKTFDKFHNTPSVLATGPPPAPLPPSNRLAWAAANSNIVHPHITEAAPPKKKTMYTQPVTLRPPAQVNTMLEERVADLKRPIERQRVKEGMMTDFVRQAHQFWTRTVPAPRRPDKPLPQELNMAEEEARYYNEWIESSAAWVLRRPFVRRLDLTYLPDNIHIVPSLSHQWTHERGARRAGLNQLLCFADNKEQRIAGPTRSLVAIPLHPETELAIKAKADGIQWVPPAVPADQLPEQLETMPYTFWWHIYLRDLTALRRKAYRAYLREAGADPDVISVPRGIINSGPYVWRQVQNGVRDQQDKLAKSRTIFKTLQLAVVREPRELLATVFSFAQRAKAGEWTAGQVPQELTLRSDEWHTVDGSTQPRFLDDEDFEWLQWLTTDGANLKNYSGPDPQYAGPKFLIYRIFADRVARLLADRSPGALFKDANTEVQVEQLITHLNATIHGPVQKVKFEPYQTCHFLDRMAQQGLVDFRPDMRYYGMVKRPQVEMYPEMCVTWSPDEVCPRFPNDLVPFASLVTSQAVEKKDAQGNVLVKDGQPVVTREQQVVAPDTNPGSALHHFFVNLGFRLGWELWQLTEQERLWNEQNIRPASPASLSSAFARFDQVMDDVAAATHAEGANRVRMVSVQEVVLRANRAAYRDNMSEDAALQLIRTGIASEAEANLEMLAPGRRKVHTEADGSSRVVLVNDINWSWAGPAARGWRRNFWSMDRWAPHDAYLTAACREARAQDRVLDWAQVFDPLAHDKTPTRWQRPKLIRFGEEGPTKFRPGPAVFPLGDTRAQQLAVEDYVTKLTSLAMNVRPIKRTWSERLKSLNPFPGPNGPPPPPPADLREGDAWLPDVTDVPVSFDPDQFLREVEGRGDRDSSPEPEPEEPRVMTRQEFRKMIQRRRRLPSPSALVKPRRPKRTRTVRGVA